MDSFIEKQGFYDYINHLITGITMIIGVTAAMSKCGKQYLFNLFFPIFYYHCPSNTNSFLVNALFFGLLMLTSFIIGIIIQVTNTIIYEGNSSYRSACHYCPMCVQRIVQMTSSYLCQHFPYTSRFLIKVNKLNLISHIFDENGPVDNCYKREKYKEYAEMLVRNKHIGGIYVGNKYTTEFAHYFYAYCVYYVQIRNHGQKVEKLRDITGLASSLSLTFTFLCSITVAFRLFICKTQNISWTISCFVSFFFLSILFDFQAERASKNQIKMVLALYEAEKEKEQGFYI